MVDLPITKWIKKKIRRLIGIVEDTDVATHSIASGKYVVWKGDLYKSTAAIAVGGTLSLSNLSPISDGGFNELSEQIQWTYLGTITSVGGGKWDAPSYALTYPATAKELYIETMFGEGDFGYRFNKYIKIPTGNVSVSYYLSYYGSSSDYKAAVLEVVASSRKVWQRYKGVDGSSKSSTTCEVYYR